MASRRVGHDWATSLSLFTFMHWRRKWQPTPVFLPGESQGQRSLVGCRLWDHRVGHDWSDLAAVASNLLPFLLPSLQRITALSFFWVSFSRLLLHTEQLGINLNNWITLKQNYSHIDHWVVLFFWLITSFYFLPTFLTSLTVLLYTPTPLPI